MESQPPKLRRRLFGYGRDSVYRILGDRDSAFRRMEERARAAEGKVSELQASVTTLREELANKDEEIEAVRQEPIAHSTSTGEMGATPAQMAAKDLELEALRRELSRTEEQLEAQREELVRRGQELEGLRQELVSVEERGVESGVGSGESARDDATESFLREELTPILRAAEEAAAQIVERARTSSREQLIEADRAARQVMAENELIDSWREQLEPRIQSVQARFDDARARIQEVPERIREALAPVGSVIDSVSSDLRELSRAARPPSRASDEGEAADSSGPDLRMAEDPDGARPNADGHEERPLPRVNLL